MTNAQLERTKCEYGRIAGEPIEVMIIGGCLYVFGSEIATLRLFRQMPSKSQGFSKNLKRHFFSVEL
jgi:hypothetical protein